MESLENNIQPKWFIVRCVTGAEAKAKLSLEKRISEENLENKILNICIPTKKIIEIHDGKKKGKEKKILPGYVFLELILDNAIKDFIMQTPHILGFMGEKNKPIPLRSDEVKRFLGKENSSTSSVESKFVIGMPVKIIDGPFANFLGTIEEVSLEKMKLKVMVSIFGRKTPVELDFTQVEEEK